MLRIHRAERSDALVDALADLVVVPLEDPFAPEVVAVPTRGVERWLTHRIGARAGATSGRADGVCANVEFPYPSRLVGDAVALATGIGRDEDPWRVERMVWPLLDVIDECAGEAWLAILGRHLGVVPSGDGFDDLRGRRAMSTARAVAGLFDRYATHRPSMLRGWLDPAVDDEVPDDAAWQAELYRRLSRRIEDRTGAPAPAARLGEACRRIAAGDVALGLPERLSVFGLTRLPAAHLDVLVAIAAQRDVHVFALHPSAAWWDAVAEVTATSTDRRGHPSARVARHPLLRNWADDARELQLVLAGVDDADVVHHAIPDDPATTVLARIQQDIRNDRPPPGADRDDRLRLDPDDRSVQIHACHGRFRQVEVLRDAICHVMADDPSIEPRDVIVLCPDIEAFAPSLDAVFGAHPDPEDDDLADPGRLATAIPHLPHRLADRALRQTNPLLEALQQLLELAGSRLRAPDVLAFAGLDPVRRRFGFDDDALDRLATWIGDSGVRWGIDAAHRAPWNLAKVGANTWRTGLDRILLGVAMDESGARLVGNTLPLDDVDSGAVDLAGRLAELLDRLDALVDDASTTHSIGTWVELLGRAVDDLTLAPGRESWQRAQVDRVLRATASEATSAGATSERPLSRTEVSALLAHRLRGAPSHTDFRTGAITMCTLVPMRAVPHRVVCVLGLDADAFPRVSGNNGDDLLARHPRIGDQDPRTEDRQLLLDAVLSATQHLVLTYSAHDERTNERRPPAVPLSEFLEVIDQTVEAPASPRASDAVTFRHPLQPFAAAAFSVGDGAVDPRRVWGFDRIDHAGATAAGSAAPAHRRFLVEPLAPLDESVIDLEALVRFFQHPAREFLRQRLDVSTWEDDTVLSSTIPYELDGLESWRVGTRLLDHVLAGLPIGTAADAARTEGVLPPGELGRVRLTSICRTVEVIQRKAEAVLATGPATSLEVDVACGGSRVVGTVADVRGERIGRVSYSSTKPKDRLAAWIRLLALTATRPHTAWDSVIVGRRRNGATTHLLSALDGPTEARQATAIDLLGHLVELRQRGLCAPLPLPCATAEAWMTSDRWNRSPEANARREWTASKWSSGESADTAHVLVHGPDTPFDELVAIPADDDDAGPGWDTSITSRLGRLAHHVWTPLLARETAR